MTRSKIVHLAAFALILAALVAQPAVATTDVVAEVSADALCLAPAPSVELEPAPEEAAAAALGLETARSCSQCAPCQPGTIFACGGQGVCTQSGCPAVSGYACQCY